MEHSGSTRFERLGYRTFLSLLLRRGWVLVLTLAILAGLLTLLAVIPERWSAAISTVFWFGVLLGVIAIGGSLNAAWMEYIHYGIFLGETDFRFRHGIISEEDIGIPYRRVRQVRTIRNSRDILLGVSTLAIDLSDDGGDPERSTIKIAGLDKQMAETLQEALLKKAEVEQIKLHS